MRSEQEQEASVMIILQTRYVQDAANGFWQLMAKTAKCWSARIGNADTEKLFPEPQMPAVPNAIKRWK